MAGRRRIEESRDAYFLFTPRGSTVSGRQKATPCSSLVARRCWHCWYVLNVPMSECTIPGLINSHSDACRCFGVDSPQIKALSPAFAIVRFASSRALRILVWSQRQFWRALASGRTSTTSNYTRMESS
jgi:hypothetical protein